MSIEQERKQEAQRHLKVAIEKKNELMKTPTAILAVKPTAFKAEVDAIFSAMIAAVWKLTE